MDKSGTRAKSHGLEGRLCTIVCIDSNVASLEIHSGKNQRASIPSRISFLQSLAFPLKLQCFSNQVPSWLVSLQGLLMLLKTWTGKMVCFIE